MMIDVQLLHRIASFFSFIKLNMLALKLMKYLETSFLDSNFQIK